MHNLRTMQSFAHILHACLAQIEAARGRSSACLRKFRCPLLARGQRTARGKSKMRASFLIPSQARRLAGQPAALWMRIASAGGTGVAPWTGLAKKAG